MDHHQDTPATDIDLLEMLAKARRDGAPGRVSVSHTLATIQRAVRELGLPEPVHRCITDQTITLEFRTTADVDAWQRHLGMAPAAHLGDGQYATSDTGPDVWCDAQWVFLHCESVAEVSAP